MKTVKLLILFTAILSAILIAGCSKDDDTPVGEAQKFEVKSVQVPKAMSQSNDPGAQMATSYVNMINGLSGFSSLMAPPGNKPDNISNGERTFTWDVNDKTGIYTVKLVIKETNSEIIWDMYIDGTMEGNVLNNFHYIHAVKQKDESGSVFTVWDPDTGSKFMELSWSVIANESVKFVFEVFNETYLTVIVNSDGSGSIELKEWLLGGYVTTYKASWAASGHGQYQEFVNGVLDNNGSW